MFKKNKIMKSYRLNEQNIEQLKTLSEILDVSQSEILEQLINAMFLSRADNYKTEPFLELLNYCKKIDKNEPVNA